MSPDKPTLDQDHEIVVVDPEEVREKRRLKFWIIKVIVGLLGFVVIMVVSGLMYDFVFQSGDLNESLIGNFFSSLMKILEVMFTSI